MGEDRRHPRGLEGVLRLAVEAGSASEGPGLQEPMSDERRAFLQAALAEVCKGQMDEVEQMKECLAVLMKDRESEEEEDEEDGKEAALELLSDLCENLDNARDLMKLGGLELCVSRCLCHPEAGMRWRAAQLIASCAQNMPEVQCHLLNQGALHTLLQLTDNDTHSTVRVKALYAVSCLVREQEVGLRDFLSKDGFSVLMRAIQSDCEKLQTKAAFLLLNLLTSHPEHKDTVLSMGMVEQLVSVLRSPHSSVHEHVLGALCCLVEDSAQAVSDCRAPSLGLEELLNQRIQELRGREESQEEFEFCERLRTTCFRPHHVEDNGMDR
ncbi:hsp70-binding protein 1 isoform X2 [Chanos chanos]|uniref:Hsp70-binding protein 1 n=1 Tax=Chanos chanos TaxID=29144 RepID=A0A6J2WZN3_CHACN|nr:hsp70-binding protein 1 isoform X2 [Chanos chanos]